MAPRKLEKVSKDRRDLGVNSVERRQQECERYAGRGSWQGLLNRGCWQTGCANKLHQTTPLVNPTEA